LIYPRSWGSKYTEADLQKRSSKNLGLLALKGFNLKFPDLQKKPQTANKNLKLAKEVFRPPKMYSGPPESQDKGLPAADFFPFF
jgi:hypothetical protein